YSVLPPFPTRRSSDLVPAHPTGRRIKRIREAISAVDLLAVSQQHCSHGRDADVGGEHERACGSAGYHCSVNSRVFRRITPGRVRSEEHTSELQSLAYL